MKKLTLLALPFLLLSFAATAQYEFQNKEAKKLYNDLEGYYNDYDYDGILNEEERILTLFEPKQDTLTALMYSFLSEAYYYYGETPTAYEYSLQEYELRQKVDPENEEGIKNIVFLLAQYADELGLYEDAEQYYLQILDSDRKKYGARSPEYVATALNLATHYGYTKDYEELKEGIRLLRPLSRQVDENDPEYPRVLKQLGFLYAEMGSNRRADNYYADAVAAYDRLGMYATRENATALSDISLFYQAQGKYPEAEKTLTEALSIINRLPGENEDILNLLKNNIASVYLSIGNYEAAEENIREAIQLVQEVYGPGTYSEAISLTGLGLILRMKDDLDGAEEKYKEAMAILEAGGAQETFDYFNLLNNLSNIYKERGALDEALTFAVQSSDGFKMLTGDKSAAYAKTLYNIAEIYMMKGMDETGEEYLKNAQRIVKSELGEFHPEYARITLKLAINQWSQEKMEDAESYYLEVFDNYFRQLESYFPTLSEEEKTKFYTNKLKPAFEQFNSFLFARSRDEEPLLGLMYDYQLATKGLLLYATNKVRESIVNSGDTTLLNKYFDWIDQKEQLSKLYSSTDQDLDTRNAKIDSLTALANALEKDLSEASDAFAGTYTQGRKTWQDVRNQLKVGEAAIEIIRFKSYKPEKGGDYTDEVYYAALILKAGEMNQPELVVLRNGAQMESRFLANYRNAIKFQVNEDYSYNLFWKPISRKLEGIEKVYFSPDGVYNQISIYTLLNSETGNFLLDEIDLQLVTNSKDLTLAKAQTSQEEATDKALFFGFPNYNYGVLETDESRQDLASSVADAASKGRGDDRGVRGTRGGRGPQGGDALPVGNTRGGGSLSRGLRGNLQRYVSGNNLMALLPGTKKEVESIAEIFKNLEKTPETYLSNDATENKLKEAKNPSTLHIATHGFFLETEKLEEAGGEIDTYVTNPLLRSGLILAGANSFLAAGMITEDSEDGDDGILTAYEAMNLNLDKTDLVVLSACETGLGEVSNGEGVYGLQRAFQVAGAESIIMSMWTVDDAATQELMTFFYEEWIKTGNKQEAFVKAQKRLKDKWESPYYWGAFVMVGS